MIDKKKLGIGMLVGAATSLLFFIIFETSFDSVVVSLMAGVIACMVYYMSQKNKEEKK